MKRIILLLIVLVFVSAYSQVFASDEGRREHNAVAIGHVSSFRFGTPLYSSWLFSNQDVSSFWWEYLVIQKYSKPGWIRSDFPLKTKIIGKPLVGKIIKGNRLN